MSVRLRRSQLSAEPRGTSWSAVRARETPARGMLPAASHLLLYLFVYCFRNFSYLFERQSVGTPQHRRPVKRQKPAQNGARRARAPGLVFLNILTETARAIASTRSAFPSRFRLPRFRDDANATGDASRADVSGFAARAEPRARPTGPARGRAHTTCGPRPARERNGIAYSRAASAPATVCRKQGRPRPMSLRRADRTRVMQTPWAAAFRCGTRS